MLGTKLKFFTAFHSQTDSQIEVVNKNLGNMLHTFVGEHVETRDLKLATAKFAYNTAVNRTTGKSLHEIVYGFRLKQLIDLFLCQIILEHQILHHHLHHMFRTYTRKLWIKLFKVTPTTRYEWT